VSVTWRRDSSAGRAHLDAHGLEPASKCRLSPATYRASCQGRQTKIRHVRAGTFRFIWGVPIALAVLTIFGLLAALLGDGIWRALAWLAIAIPVLVALRFGLRAVYSHLPAGNQSSRRKSDA
jgi:hypothetical protein